MTSATDSSHTSPDRVDRPWLIGALAAATVIAVLVVLGSLWFRTGEREDRLLLFLGAEDATASCLALDPVVLAEMSPAFAGTARSVDGETVVLDVDRWYAGEDGTAVELRAPVGLDALIGGISFEEGQRYLITATDGMVNYCGYSGLATPELQSVYDAAYGS